MGLRPAKCYRWDSPAYTRKANNPGDSYITGLPAPKIVHFEAGNLKGEFDTEIALVSEETIQIRSNALEAVRVAANKVLEKDVGVNNYMLKVRVYPHHVLRENVMATGAGADRVQEGMRKAFGKPMGSAARVQRNQKILSIYINKSDDMLKKVKVALKKGVIKLPTKTYTLIEPVKK